MHEPDDAPLADIIEALLFVSGEPVNRSAIRQVTGADTAAVELALDDLDKRLRNGIRLQRQGDDVQLVTDARCAEAVRRYRGVARPAPLSRAALETLTVVAYRQPVTRSEIEAARGVNSDRALETLLARDLVEERGQRPAIGRPTQYGTGFRFLEYFGLATLSDLPALPEQLESVDPRDLGFRAEAEEKEKRSS